MITAQQWWDTYTYFCVYPNCEESYPLFEPDFGDGREIEQGDFLYCKNHIREVIDALNAGAGLENFSYGALREKGEQK